MSTQIEKIKAEFTEQAHAFNDYQSLFSKEEYNKFVIENMRLTGKEQVLEVAAGTCAFGRSVAPFVEHIVELDATEAMLNVGKEEGKRHGISNASYYIGLAEELPFSDRTFDAVISRPAFHHFEDADVVYREMCRVLKDCGKLVIVDMGAKDASLRGTADDYEALRDPSHIKCLSEKEFADLAEQNGMITEYCETTFILVKLSSWMELTCVPENTKDIIISAMKADILGGAKTGFEPYEQDGEIMFNHRWIQIIAKK